MENTKAKRIAIVGSGIIGVCAAIQLQREGHEVLLIDSEGPAAGSSYGNGGILVPSGVIPINSPGLLQKAPGMLMRSASPLFVRWSYLPKMLPWLFQYLRRANAHNALKVATALAPLLHQSLQQHRALAKGTVAEKWIHDSDYVFVYENREAYEKDAFAWSVRQQLGFEWDEMENSMVDQYEPVLAGRNKFAVRLGGHGRISDPGKYVVDLASHITGNGGKQIVATAEQIVHKSGELRGLKTSAGMIECDALVLAAGAWSRGLLEDLGLKIPLESERGYHLELLKPSVMPSCAMMIAAGKFVITPLEGRIRCAGMVEFGGLEAPASKAPIELLKKHIRELLPALKYEDTEQWMGHRPAPVDSIPFIGSVKHLRGVFAAFGHHHVGLTAGARTGRLVADLVANRTPEIDIQPYRLDRFTH